MGSPRQKRVAAAVLLASLAITALFLAQGSTRLLASFLLPIDPSVGGEGAGGRRSAKATKARETKSDRQILTRNIFDSESGNLFDPPRADEPSEVAEEQVPEDIDPNAPPPPCDGPVRLVGAVVNPVNPAWSFAAMVGPSGKAMLYRSGMSIEGRELVAIGSQRVIMRPSGGRVCSLAMFAEDVPPSAPRAQATPSQEESPEEEPTDRRPPSRDGAISSADMEAGITRVSDTNFNVTRGLVDRILENQAELMRTARIIPHEENGRVVGVKMYGIRRNSLLGRLGMQNGDMMRTINGFDMSSPDSALEAYARLRNADHLTLNVVRRGQAMTIDYNIQ